LHTAIRELDRERSSLQSQEKKLIAEIKQMAKQNQLSAVRVMAKDLIRTRHSVTKLYALKSQLQGVSLRMQTLKSTQAMSDAMRCVSGSLVASYKCGHLTSVGSLSRFGQRRHPRDGGHEPPAEFAGAAEYNARV
jgi:charged multivesicular body protein 2A